MDVTRFGMPISHLGKLATQQATRQGKHGLIHACHTRNTRAKTQNLTRSDQLNGHGTAVVANTRGAFFLSSA